MKKQLMLLLVLCLCAACLLGCTTPADDNNQNEPDTPIDTPVTPDASDPVTDPKVNIGDFSATDLEGNTVNKDIFADYSITMVNLWTTWCTYCIEEMPHLAEISNEMQADGVQIIGLICDVADQNSGEIDEEKLALAKEIITLTGATYPIIMPDAVLNAGILADITTFPTTLFVDSNGDIIGEAVSGAKSKEAWQQLINEKLEAVAE